jgi:tRNA G18 (ribose-2'-O)-methylase SpoU
VDLASHLQVKGFKIWALESVSNSKPLDFLLSDAGQPAELVLVIGNEVTGVDPGILSVADNIVSLPMRGHKSSFNVAVAFALAAQILRSRM